LRPPPKERGEISFSLHKYLRGSRAIVEKSRTMALPVQTMTVGALLGIEPLTLRKSLGVAIAMLGVFAALASGLSAAPEGAWRGEAIMTGAALSSDTGR
jgi:hypothetical protein